MVGMELLVKEVVDSLVKNDLKDTKLLLNFIKKKASLMEDFITFSEMEFKVREKTYQKFKKYPGRVIKELLEVWDEQFIDEDTGEVVGIERYRVLGYFEDNGNKGEDYIWLNHSVIFDKERKEMQRTLGSFASVLTYMYNNDLLKVRDE